MMDQPADVLKDSEAEAEYHHALDKSVQNTFTGVLLLTVGGILGVILSPQSERAIDFVSNFLSMDLSQKTKDFISNAIPVTFLGSAGFYLWAQLNKQDVLTKKNDERKKGLDQSCTP